MLLHKLSYLSALEDSSPKPVQTAKANHSCDTMPFSRRYLSIQCLPDSTHSASAPQTLVCSQDNPCCQVPTLYSKTPADRTLAEQRIDALEALVNQYKHHSQL